MGRWVNIDLGGRNGSEICGDFSLLEDLCVWHFLPMSPAADIKCLSTIPVFKRYFNTILACQEIPRSNKQLLNTGVSQQIFTLALHSTLDIISTAC